MARQRTSTRDDFDRVKDTANKLKSENRKLRKENATLRKQLNKYGEIELTSQIDEEIVKDLIIVNEESAEKNYCPRCRSESITLIPAGRYLVSKCECGYRKRTQIK